MSTAFTTSNHSAFNDMPPPQPSSSRTSKQLDKYSSDVPVTSAGVRLSFECEYDAELAPSRPRNYIEQPLNQLSQAQNPVASTDGENSNAIDELGWAENIDEEIRRRREELERVRDESRASVFLLEDKAKGGLSPAFSPAVHEFVSLVMAGSVPSSAFSSTYPVAHKEGMLETPNGDYLQTPSHSIFSSRAKGALGFIKDEALRLRADLEQQAGLLASERQRSEQLQEEMAELTRQRKSLSQELEARELKIVNYEDSLGELQTMVANEREANQHREENLQAHIEELQLALERHTQRDHELQEFHDHTGQRRFARTEEQEVLICELQKSVIELQYRLEGAENGQTSVKYLEEELKVKNSRIQELEKYISDCKKAAPPNNALFEEATLQEKATESVEMESQTLRSQLDEESLKAGTLIYGTSVTSSSSRRHSSDVGALVHALDASEAAKKSLEARILQEQQSAEQLRAELQQFRLKWDDALRNAVHEEETTARSLRKQIEEQEEVVKILRHNLSNVERARDEMGVRADEAGRQGTREELSQEEKEEIQSLRDEIEVYKAELVSFRREQLEKERTTAMNVAVSEHHSSTHEADMELPEQPADSTIQRLEDVNRLLSERVRTLEEALSQVGEMEIEKRELMRCVDALKDALEQEREGHQQHFEKTVTTLNEEISRIAAEMHQMEKAKQRVEKDQQNISMFVLRRMLMNIRTKHMLKNSRRAFYRWVASTSSMQLEQLQTIRESGSQRLEGAQGEEVRQLEAENRALLEELKTKPAILDERVFSIQDGKDREKRWRSEGISSFAFKIIFAVLLFLALERGFVLHDGRCDLYYLDSPRVTM